MISRKKMTKRYKNREDEVLKGYVKLVEAMLVLVYDRIRIKDSWQSKKISVRMLDKKRADLDDLGAWLQTENCKTWFDILGQCTGMGSKKMLEAFLRTYDSSLKFIEEHEEKQAVDK